MLRSVYLLFFILFITLMQGQKPVMLERYFAYSRLHNKAKENVEILNLYGDRLSKNEKEKTIKTNLLSMILNPKYQPKRFIIWRKHS